MSQNLGGSFPTSFPPQEGRMDLEVLKQFTKDTVFIYPTAMSPLLSPLPHDSNTNDKLTLTQSLGAIHSSIFPKVVNFWGHQILDIPLLWFQHVTLNSHLPSPYNAMTFSL